MVGIAHQGKKETTDIIRFTWNFLFRINALFLNWLNHKKKEVHAFKLR